MLVDFPARQGPREANRWTRWTPIWSPAPAVSVWPRSGAMRLYSPPSMGPCVGTGSVARVLGNLLKKWWRCDLTFLWFYYWIMFIDIFGVSADDNSVVVPSGWIWGKTDSILIPLCQLFGFTICQLLFCLRGWGNCYENYGSEMLFFLIYGWGMGLIVFFFERTWTEEMRFLGKQPHFT